MVFTETWLHSDITISLIVLDGFSLLCSDRSMESGKTRGWDYMSLLMTNGVGNTQHERLSVTRMLSYYA